MRKGSVKRLTRLIAAGCWLLVAPLFAETVRIDDFRSDLTNAKIVSLGGSFLGGIDNPQAGFVNPALIVGLSGSRLEMSRAEIYGWGMNLYGASYGFKTGRKSALSVTWANEDSFDMPIYDVSRYPVNGEPTGEGLIVDASGNPVSFGSFHEYQSIFMFNAAQIIAGIPVGANVRYLKHGFKGNSSDSYLDSLVNFGASAWSVDAGAVFRFKNLEFPVAFFNLASTKFEWDSEYEYNEELPEETATGVFCKLNLFSFGVDFAMIKGKNPKGRISAQFEKGFYALRASYADGRLCAGFGVSMPRGPLRLTLNYAYRSKKIFGGTHYFTTGVKW